MFQSTSKTFLKRKIEFYTVETNFESIKVLVLIEISLLAFRKKTTLKSAKFVNKKKKITKVGFKDKKIT